MTTSNVIAAPAPHTRPRCPSAHLAELELRCTQMWAIEPECSLNERHAALETLMSVERRLSSLALREAVTGRLLDRRFASELSSCELELDVIADAWNSAVSDAGAA